MKNRIRQIVVVIVFIIFWLHRNAKHFWTQKIFDFSLIFGSVSFGDAADFTERLGEAFAVAGADLVGPDFDEDLESIDLGPGASIGSIETDVNLDGLEGK